MAYTKQEWTAPQGTGLNRYAKGAETETHLTLTLDPENLTNTPTPITVARLNHMENGIVDAHAIENVYPIEWQEYALGQTTRYWTGMTTLGNDVYACISGDIYKQTGGTGDFVALGQTTRNWYGMTTLGTDVYACVSIGDIYKQTGGTGDFVALGQTARYWYGMTTLGTDVYACVSLSDIYKQTGGTGDFVALGQTARYWCGMTTLGTDVYACVNGGDIYKQTGGTGDFVALNQTSRDWYGMTTLGNDVYACVLSGDIYKQTGGTGDFVALGQTSRRWYGMTTLGNDVYACVNGGDIYKLSYSNTIRASASFTLSAYPDGSRKRIANTHATNTITCTLPSGQTMNGQTSFTITPDTLLEFELIGTAWKCASNEWEYVGSYTSGSVSVDVNQYENIRIEVIESHGWIEATSVSKITPSSRIHTTFTYGTSGLTYIGGVECSFTGKVITYIALYTWQSAIYSNIKIYGMK